jgi:hypothetical protein
VTVHPVTDRANLNDDIVTAANLIRHSKQRYDIFDAIYFGKREWKTVSALSKKTGYSKKRVTELAKRIVDHGFATTKKIDGELAYACDRILFQNKRKIFAAAKDKKKLDKIPTRNRPHVKGAINLVHLPVAKSNAPRSITVEDVSSFGLIDQAPKPDPKIKLNRMAEERMKNAFKAMIGETHDFKDWGGEKNDLYTNKLKVGGRRKAAAFAFKGKGTTGPLTPKKMGKNGDQLGRLFSSDAEVYFVVYHGKIDESVLNVMRAHGALKSLAGQSVRYGVIDGDDLNRLYQAYRQHF